MRDYNRQKNSLTKELGSSLFADIVDFVKEILKSQYDYKIMMGRRFFVVNEGLQSLIACKYGNKIEKKGVYVTNLSIALMQLIGKKILIVDDTLLHGRAIERMVSDLIECGCNRNDIAVKVYLQNESAQIVDESLLEIASFRRKNDTDRWRHVSSKIVDSFMEAGWLYMYYLPYYEASLRSEKAKRIIHYLNEMQIPDKAVISQKRHGISSYLYCSEKSFRMCRKVLIRIYKYEKSNSLFVVPYAFLKPLTHFQIAEAFKVLIQEEIVQFEGNADFLQDAHVLEMNKLKSRYAYALLTYLVSLLQGTLFLHDLDLDKWERNNSIETSSLGCKVSFSKNRSQEILTKLEQISVIDNEKYQLEQDENIAGVISDLAKGRLSSNSNNGEKMDVDYFVDHYLKLSSKRDEELAKEKKDRMRGIEVERICETISEQNAVWNKIKEVIDTGRATLTISDVKIDGMAYIDSLLYAGEQNCACNEENLAKLVYPVLQYDIYCRDMKVIEAKKKETKKQIVYRIMAQYKDLQERISKDEIDVLLDDSFVKCYGSYYFDKYSLFRDSDEVQEAMRIEKEYEQE